MSQDDRPSFGQALADAGFSDAGGFDAPAESTPVAADASGSSPEALPTTDQPPAGAITPPGDGESQSTPATKGPIPFDRHEAVLKNTRAEYEAKLAALRWAQEVPAEHAEAVAALVQQSGGNPVEFGLGFLDRLLQNPEHAAAIRSHAARLLGRRGDAAAAPAQPPGPPPPTMEVDGIALYSAADLAKRDEWLRHQLIDAVTPVVSEQIAPVQSLVQQLETAKQQQAREEQARTTAKTVFDKASKWPGWDQHKAMLAEKLMEAQQRPGYDDARVGEVLTDLYIEHVVPLMGASAEKNLLRDLKTQALTGPSPASAAPAAAAPARPKSFREYFAAS